MRWTEPDGTGNNAGHFSADLTGRTLKLLDAEERQAVYLDIAELEGFKQATRLDAQRTLLDPMATAEEVHRQVRERLAWVPRFEGYSQLGVMDSKGDAVKGASVCWGSPTGSTRCLTYNKAVEDNWEGVEAVRHEIRHRREPARDLFTALIASIRAEPDSEPAAVEAHFVQSVLNKSMAYRDTTRFAKVRDKREWPDNWAKTAPPAPFWQEVVTGVPMELKTRWNPVGSLEDTMASMGRQYGRRAGLYVLWRYIALQEPLDLILTDLLDSWAVRLRDEDLAELQALVPNEDPALVAEAFAQMRSTAAHNVEGTTRETYGK